MSLSERLKTKDLVLMDGAMGTQLSARGVVSGGQACIDAPDVVLEVHRSFVDAGSSVITANTLTMNRIYIESHGLAIDVETVNRRGIELAREAAGADRPVLGDISSTGQMLEPYGTFTEEQFEQTFREQARILADAGADGFVIETVIDLREALCALRACKAVSSLPVIASLSFATTDKGGRTVMGNAADDCARALIDEGADVIGANCGSLEPAATAEIIRVFRDATALPLLAQPNAGIPKLVGDKAVFDMPPQTFADGLAQCINAGATLIGGCCGTTPEHIRALARLV